MFPNIFFNTFPNTFSKREIWLWGIIIFFIVIRYFTFPNYRNLDGQKVRITGKITGVPIRYSNTQRVEIAGFTVYLPLFPEISYGDKIIVEGTVNLPAGKAGDKTLKNPILKEIVDGKNFLGELRQKIISFYHNNLPEPHASLVAGITLGAKSNLPADFWQSLKKSGVAHVVVASGMNVTFVTAFLISALALFLPRKRAIPFAILGILGYLALSGFDAPLVRAGIMGTVAFLAQETGKVVSGFRALIYSAALMLLSKPEWLGDLGFILSFFATASILLFEAKIKKKLLFLPSPLKEDFSTSLAAQIGVGPILFVTFGQFNILSPFINVLVLWTVPLIMIIGGLSSLVSLLYEPLGRLMLFLVYPLTGWFIWIVGIFG